jgi:hypothetical protein
MGNPHYDVVAIKIQGLLRGPLTIVRNPEWQSGADIQVTTGPFEVRLPGSYIALVCPVGFRAPAPTSVPGLRAQTINISASGGSLAAGVVHGDITIGPGGSKVTGYVEAPAPTEPSVDYAEGAVILTVAPDTTIYFRNCKGTCTGPGQDEVREMTGLTDVWVR